MYESMGVTARIRIMRERIRNRTIQIDAERSTILTKAYKNGLAEVAPIMRVPLGLYEVCSKVTCPVEDFELIVGSIGKHFCGAGVNSDWKGASWVLDMVEKGLWRLGEDGLYHSRLEDELPMTVSPEDIEAFKEVRDYWQGRTWGSPAEAWQPDFFDELQSLECTSYKKGPGGAIMKSPCGHIAPGHKKIIDKGYGAIRREALDWIAAHRGNLMGEDVEKYLFYEAAAKTCEAGTVLCRRYAQACRDKAESTVDSARKAELNRMAAGLDRISTEPASSFWEACQAALMYQLLVMLEAGPPALAFGRFDQYTWPYLKRDLDSGSLTMEQAQEIVDAFFLKAECFYKGGIGLAALSAGLGNTYQHTTIGGINPDTGEDASNPVTYMVLGTMSRLLLHDPTISLRIDPDTPDELWRCAIETSKRLGGLPLYQNDSVIIPTVQKELGYSEYDARNYCFIGCQEIVGSGVDYPAPAGVHPPHTSIHYGTILDMALNDGKNPMNGVQASLHTGYLYDMTSFEQVKKAYADMTEYIFKMYVSMQNYSEYLDTHGGSPHPALSISIEGCMESGRDCTCGGAKYNSYGGTATGLATVADSLTAIRYLCFDEKLVSTRELYDAFMANWEGYEELRSKIRRDVPHFGNNDEYADEQMVWCVNLYHDQCGEMHSVRAQKYRSGMYGASDHVVQGYSTWATPDGRKAGTPIADAASPCQGRDVCGPLAIMNSELKWDHMMMADGMALNIKIHPTAVATDEDAMKLVGLTKSYFKGGGMEVQYNIVDSETMRKAQADPQSYRDLVVRIAGYSAYFVELSKDCQDDLISRTDNTLA
ncbi:MAG: pyruvate formate lyase family protein [Coriobacteriales bacterium]|nr:pyruvate formate lyase family protein [Coriobacteriales bacterium]